MWLIVGGAAVVIGLLVWADRRPKTFSYKGKSYTRRADGSYIHSDGALVIGSERDEVDEHWQSTHDSGSSNSSDGSGNDGAGDGGGGDGGGGGGDD